MSAPRCLKCGETLEALMFWALMADNGAQGSVDPLACKHDFGGALLAPASREPAVGVGASRPTGDPA